MSKHLRIDMQILVIILTLSVASLQIFVLYQRASHKKELADVSDTIARIMDGRELVSQPDSEETLVYKIHSQLMRLRNVNDSYRQGDYKLRAVAFLLSGKLC